MNKLLISLLLVNLLSACSTMQNKDVTGTGKVGADAAATKSDESAITKPTEPAVTKPVGSAAASASSSGASSMSPMASIDPLNAPDSLLSKRSTYYPFDVSVVQDADRPIVEAHAKYLSGHPDRKVRLEGNCDERGSDEYNLALGQRRADGVKKLLLVGGARDSQIEAISYGEAKPRLTCHEEKCWKENRRTDLNYSVQK